MNRKTKNFITLLVIFIVITSLGSYYSFFVQGGDLRTKEDQLNKLRADYASFDLIKAKLLEMEERIEVVDSLLFTGKFIIPKNLSQSQFFDFVESYSNDDDLYSYTDTEFDGRNIELGINYYTYKVSGRMNYNNVYKLIYAIEQSKELKKITQLSLGNLIRTDQDGVPLFLVSFEMTVQVYHSSDNRFAPAVFTENRLSTGPIYDAFYPLIRNEIPPNVDGLLDVQGAKLLALIPEGAFVADTKGNTYLVWEGEQVYLGYLTKIDYDNNSVSFILNKGGIIEKVTLELEKNK